MNIKVIEEHAAALYNRMVEDSYIKVEDSSFKDKADIDFQQIFRLSWDAAAYFDQQFTLERKRQANADPGWQTAKRKVRERDEDKCRRCGSEEKPEVHHIIPFELAPGLHTQLWNLVLLCRSCHVSIQGRELEHRLELSRLVETEEAA
jgi:hypothetical protein